jgi:hypothetical protein
MTPLDPFLFLVLLAALLGWRLYSRFRGLGRRRRLSRVRPWIYVAFFSLVIAMLGWFSAVSPLRLVWLAAGVAAGAAVAVYGLWLTRLEVTSEGFFYTPNVYVSLAITAVLVTRLAWRMYEVAVHGTQLARNNADFVRSAPTLAVLGLLSGYYLAYATGLLRWRFGARHPDRES